MDLTYLNLAIGVLVITVLLAFFSRSVSLRKNSRWIAVILGIVVVVGTISPETLPFLGGSVGLGGSGTLAVAPSGSTSTSQVISTYQPTAQYSAKDIFATTIISGTSYYKANTLPATTTAISNVNSGDVITYWVDNVTGYYWVQPTTQTVGTSVNRLLANSYKNGTAVLSVLDATGQKAGSVASGTANVSGASGSTPSINIQYQGAYQQSASPFGGAFVVEYNNTVSSVSCTSDQFVSSNPFVATGGSINPGKLQYTLAGSTANTYSVFYFGKGLDDGTATLKNINCKFNVGSTGLTGSKVYFYFIPANYYVGIDGGIYLDLQKNANSVNTLTGGAINQPNAFSYWG